MFEKTIFCFILILSVSAFSGQHNLHAHGVSGSIEPGGMTAVAAYDDGEPMSYAKVTVSAPDSDHPFQTGATDRNGRFCFFPDAAGEWKVVVDDGMGHRLELKTDINQVVLKEKAAVSSGEHQSIGGKADKAILGVSIIFLLGGFLFWWSAKKRLAKKSANGNNTP